MPKISSLFNLARFKKSKWILLTNKKITLLIKISLSMKITNKNSTMAI